MRVSYHPSKRRRYQALFVSVCCLLWLVAGLLAAEVALRLVLPVLISLGETEAEEKASQTAAYDDKWQVTKDGGGVLWKVPGWEYRPNSRLEKRDGDTVLTLSINQHGFRGPDFAIPKPAGVIRIVCVGGSTTLNGISDEYTYPYLLQSRLNELLGTDRVEVVNAGISGFTTRHELLKMPVYLALEPDLIVEHSGVNDVFLAASERDRAAMPWWWRLAQRSLLFQMAGSPWLGNVAHELNDPSPVEMQEFLRQESMENLLRMNEMASEQGVEMFCLTFGRPAREELSPRDHSRYDWNVRMRWRMNGDFRFYCDAIDIYNKELTRICAQHDIPLIPLHEELTGGFEVYSDICHCTTEGTEQKARIVADYLKDHVAERLANAEAIGP